MYYLLGVPGALLILTGTLDILRSGSNNWNFLALSWLEIICGIAMCAIAGILYLFTVS